MSEFKERTQALLEDSKLKLAGLLQAQVPRDPALISSGKLLAEQYAFQIQALTAGLDPEQYYKVSSAHSTMVEIQFGKHPEDILGKNFQYDMDGRLHEESGIVTLWRRTGQPDFVKKK
jgi:hypothetical protein